MCRENNWGFCRLDGSISMKKRQKMVRLQCVHHLKWSTPPSYFFRCHIGIIIKCDEFNDPSSSLVAFLLSSKAGGWWVPAIHYPSIHYHTDNYSFDPLIMYVSITSLYLNYAVGSIWLEGIGWFSLTLIGTQVNVQCIFPCVIDEQYSYMCFISAVDKQAAARCWRDGQKKRCFTYRFLVRYLLAS